VRRERQVLGWLVAQGVPGGAASALIWIAKLAVLGVLLYAAFWLALLVVVAVFAAWTAELRDPEEEEEWHFVDLNELRKSPGYDPNLYNDTSHELYEDD
jgi:fatty acid desaturase